VRVRDVVAELRALAANITYLCHYDAPNLFVFRAAGTASGGCPGDQAP
jgi:hypothetical protein